MIMTWLSEYGKDLAILVLAASLAGICAAAVLLQFRRKKHIREFIRETDRLLHGEENFRLSRYREDDLNQLENQVQKLTVRLREQADLLQKDKKYLADSIADISHQIRTPLTAIHLICTSLMDENLSEEDKNSLWEIKRQLGRMDWLINSLLKIARLDAGTITFQSRTYPLKELADQALLPLEIQMELKNQQIRKEIDGSFCGDLSWTAEALGNILKNCSEHTPEGGTIRLTGHENALYTEITVRDTGPGIAPEDLPHLFERFYRGKDAKDQSIGIGLALSRMILARQNATLQARNSPKGGAEFIIRFYKTTV